jgi:hypothetical protein
MNPLIICYSLSGNNNRLAMKLKDVLGCKTLAISEKIDAFIDLIN